MSEQNQSGDRVVAARRLLDLVSVPQIGLMFIVFFFPLAKLDCGTIRVNFSGPSLAFGLKPDVEGLPDEGGGGGSEKNDMKASFLLVLVPLALLAAGAAIVLRITGRGAMLPRRIIPILCTAVTAILLFYWVIGFAVERQIGAELKKQSTSGDAFEREMQQGLNASVSYGKTGWFYFLLLLSMTATATTFIYEKVDPTNLEKARGYLAGKIGPPPPPSPPPAPPPAAPPPAVSS